MERPERGFLRRQINRNNPPANGAAANGETPNGVPHAEGTVPTAVIDRAQAVIERTAAMADPADRPRPVLGREALELKYRLHDRMIREIDPARMTADLSPEEARRAVGDAVAQLLVQEGANVSRTDKLTLMREIADEIIGFGPIEPLLQDDTITEVMVNGPDRVFFERAGTLQLSNRVFRDNDHIMRLIEKIVSPLGRRIDESSPMVDRDCPTDPA